MNAESEITNSFIAKKLREVAKQRSNRGETHAANAHKKAALIIEKCEEPIRTYEDAIKLKGIGKSIASKVKEIVETRQLECLNVLSDEDKILELFTNIWGFGPSIARNLHEKGYTSINDLRNAVNRGELTLTHQQSIGLRHYEDFQKKMPRQEMELVLELLEAILDSIANKFPAKIHIAIVGSYRRGGTESKDVDLLLWPEEDIDLSSIMSMIKNELISVEAEILSCGESQLFAVLNLGTFRRVDIFAANYEEYACAMLAHTGPASFNVRLRGLAIEKNWLLNEKGLFDSKGKRIITRTEDDIQRLLGLEPLEPRLRF